MIRAQASLEYIATYGWAFLAILLAIGGLAYAGVFNLSSYRASECVLPPGLICEDFDLNLADNVIRLVIRNNHPVPITITSLEIQDATLPFADCSATVPITLNPEEVVILDGCAPYEEPRFRYFYDLSISGTFEQSGVPSPYEHTILGTLRGKFI